MGGGVEIPLSIREAEKKSFLLMAGRAIKRGREGKGPGYKGKKELFLEPFLPTFQNFNGH